MPAPAEVQAATIDTVIQGWREGTTESWTSFWSDSCTQTMLPTTLGAPILDKAQVLRSLPAVFSVLSNWQLLIQDIIFDTSKSKAVVYAKSFADTIFDGFKWENEYCVIFTLNEEGTKVDKIEEMVDTAFYREFRSRLERHMAETASQAI